MAITELSEKLKDYYEIIGSEDEELQYVIDQLLPENFLLLISGRRGKKKSIIALFMALCISTGQSFLNWSTTKHSVLYLDLENSIKLIRKRLRKLGIARPGDFKFLLRESIASLDIERDEKKIIEVCKDKIVFIDTLSKIHKAQENSNEQMTAVMERLVNLARTVCKGMVIIHHRGKVEDLGARGASSIEDCADVVIGVSTNSDVIDFRCEKHRDGDEGSISKQVKITFTSDKILIEDVTDEELNTFIARLGQLPPDNLSSQGRIIESLEGEYSHYKVLELLKEGTKAGLLTVAKGRNNTYKYSLRDADNGVESLGDLSSTGTPPKGQCRKYEMRLFPKTRRLAPWCKLNDAWCWEASGEEDETYLCK